MRRLTKVGLPADLPQIQSTFQSGIKSARKNCSDIGSFSLTPCWKASLLTFFRKYQAATKEMSKYANLANFIKYMKTPKN